MILLLLITVIYSLLLVPLNSAGLSSLLNMSKRNTGGKSLDRYTWVIIEYVISMGRLKMGRYATERR